MKKRLWPQGLFSKQRENEIFEEDVVSLVCGEFEKRRQEKLPFELQWQLNMNFLNGNQYCDIDGDKSGIYTIEKLYDYQERTIYNNIAPIIETRLSKLTSLIPQVSCTSKNEAAEDISCAKLSGEILSYVYENSRMKNCISNATHWSEICGTAFYKQIWNPAGGNFLGKINGKNVFEGDARVVVCPPHEIFPESPNLQNLADMTSLIHAKPYSVKEINETWGKKLKGCDVDVLSLSRAGNVSGGFLYSATVLNLESGKKTESDVVLEFYEKPSSLYPDGRLIIVAYGNRELLYYGPLPYINGKDGERTFPFIKQTSIKHPGCFWGSSIIERLIPIQRDYNALQNRINEYLNRASVGIPLIEEGSVDIDAIESEGLAPGTPIIYNIGSTPPKFMDTPPLPSAFMEKQDRLETAFITISGTSEISRNSKTPQTVSSGVAIERLQMQDDMRLSLVTEQINECLLECALQWIRLYQQFSTPSFLYSVCSGIEELNIDAFKNNKLLFDNIEIKINENNVITDEEKKAVAEKILSLGLLEDPHTGKIKRSDKARILSMLGYDKIQGEQTADMLQILRADEENSLILNNGIPQAEPYDDHELHLEEHQKLLLSPKIRHSKNPALMEALKKHIKTHEKLFAKNEDTI